MAFRRGDVVQYNPYGLSEWMGVKYNDLAGSVGVVRDVVGNAHYVAWITAPAGYKWAEGWNTDFSQLLKKVGHIDLPEVPDAT